MRCTNHAPPSIRARHGVLDLQPSFGFAGAMLLLETAAAMNTTPSGYLQPLEQGIIPSKLRVLFSTITKIKQLQYIPVKVRYSVLQANAGQCQGV